MSQAKRVAVNTFSSWIGLFVTAGTMVFLFRFLLHRLGSERFGMFRYVATIQGSLMFLDLGLSATLNRFTSRSLAVKDYKGLNSTASFGFLMFLLLGTLAGAVMVVIGFFLPSLVTGAAAASYSRGFLLMCCFAGMIALRFWGYSARGLLFGAQRYDLVNAIQAGGAILRAGLIAAIFVRIPSSDLVTIGLCYLLSTVIETLSMWVFAKRQIPTLRLGISMITMDTAKEVMSFSIFVLIMGVTTMLIWNIPTFFAGRFYGAEAVTFLSFSVLLLDMIQRVAGGFGFSLIPVAGKYSALGEAEILRKLTTVGTKYCAVLCFPLGVLAVVFGHPIFEWFEKGLGWTWALLGILMVPYLMRMTQRPTFSVLVGAKSIRQLAVGQVLLVIVIGILAWVFGEYFGMGLYGIVLGAAIPILYFDSIWQTRYACRQLGLKWLSYMGYSYGRAAVGTIPAVVVAVILVRYVYPKSLIMIIAEGVVCMLVFAVCAWWFVLNKEEREQILGVLKYGRASEKQMGSDAQLGT